MYDRAADGEIGRQWRRYCEHNVTVLLCRALNQERLQPPVRLVFQYHWLSDLQTLDRRFQDQPATAEAVRIAVPPNRPQLVESVIDINLTQGFKDNWGRAVGRRVLDLQAWGKLAGCLCLQRQPDGR